jgi:hypothetical protein
MPQIATAEAKNQWERAANFDPVRPDGIRGTLLAVYPF